MLKNAPLLSSLALVFSIAATGCASNPPKPSLDTDSCIEINPKSSFFGLVKTTETAFSQSCGKATMVRDLANMKGSDGRPDPRAAAAALLIYAKMSQAEKELADAKLGAIGKTTQDLKKLTEKNANGCAVDQTSHEITITCAALPESQLTPPAGP